MKSDKYTEEDIYAEYLRTYKSGIIIYPIQDIENWEHFYLPIAGCLEGVF